MTAHTPFIRPLRILADIDHDRAAAAVEHYRRQRAEYVARYRAADLVASRQYARRRALHMGRLARMIERTL